MKSRIGIELTEREAKSIISNSELEKYGDEEHRMKLALAEINFAEREKVANGSPDKFYDKYKLRVKKVYNKNRIFPILVMSIVAIIYMLFVPQRFKSEFASTLVQFQALFVGVSLIIMVVNRYGGYSIEDYGQNIFDFQRDELEKKSASKKAKAKFFVALIIFGISHVATFYLDAFSRMPGSIADKITVFTSTINFVIMGFIVSAEMLFVRSMADGIEVKDLQYSTNFCPNCGHLYSFFTSDIGKKEYTYAYYRQKEVVNGREVTVGGIYADGKRVGDIKESQPGYRVYDKIIDKYVYTTHTCAHCGYQKTRTKTVSSKNEGEYIGKI